MDFYLKTSASTLARFQISEMNITGTLPEAGNLKLIITRPLPSCTAIEGVYTKADRKLSKMDRNTSKVLVKCH